MNRVYRYGLLRPCEGAEEVERQLSLAHRYYNDLIELERERRDRLRAAEIEHVEGLRDALAVCADAESVVAERLEALSAYRASDRSRSEPEDMRIALRDARAYLREATKAFASIRRKRKQFARFVDAEDAIRAEFSERKRALRPGSMSRPAELAICHGAYTAIEDAAMAASKSPIWDGARANNPRFRAWDGEGLIGVQVQGGVDVAPVLSGEHSHVRIVERDMGNADPSSNRSMKRRRMMLWLRVASTGKGNREPVWCKFPMVMHRPLPAGARIKRAMCSRKMIGPRAEWSLLLTLEMPEPEQNGNDGAVAVDIGWRLHANGDIRIGHIYSTSGESREIVMPASVGQSIGRADELRSIRDREFDSIKSELSTWRKKNDGNAPGWCIESLAFIGQWRAQKRLASLFGRWRDDRFTGDSAIFAAVERWYHRDRHLWQWETSQRKGALRHRRERYRIAAAELADRYGSLVLEDFDLRKMAKLPAPEDDSDNPHARANRVRCSPSEFRMALVNAFSSRGGCVHTVDPALTTMTCHVCGSIEKFDAAALVRHTCVNGHAWDQDDNAARNILDSWRERRDGDGGAVTARDPQGDDPPEDRWSRARRLRKERDERLDRSQSGSQDKEAS